MENGLKLNKEEAREIFYGMSMEEWKTNYQTEASKGKQDDFQKAFSENVKS